jgi:hypothetical protein
MSWNPLFKQDLNINSKKQTFEGVGLQVGGSGFHEKKTPAHTTSPNLLPTNTLIPLFVTHQHLNSPP